MRTLSVSDLFYEGNCKSCGAECKSEQMRGGKIVILVFLASDESESSQRIGMLDNRQKKKKKNPWEQGAGRRAMMITQPQRIPGYHAGFLCWETDKDIQTWARK